MGAVTIALALHVRVSAQNNMVERLNAAQRATLNARMGALADGDRAAFQPVFEALWPRMRAWACVLLQDETQAEDAAQQALLRVFEQSHDFRKDKDVLTWGLTLVMWECRTLRKKRRRMKDGLLAHASEPLEAEKDPFETLQYTELRAHLERVLGVLSEEDKAMLLREQDRVHKPLTPRERTHKKRLLERVRMLWRKMYGT